MKEITITNLLYAVATSNGDAFVIENEEQAEEVYNAIQDSSYFEELTNEDEFASACEKLDFDDPSQPKKIYSFFNQCQWFICFDEDY